MTSFPARILVIALAAGAIQLAAQPAIGTGGGTWTVPGAAEIDMRFIPGDGQWAMGSERRTVVHWQTATRCNRG
jgi:hypothetical protein